MSSVGCKLDIYAAFGRCIIAFHAVLKILVRKGRFEPEVALGVAEAIEISINLTQVVTVPVLEARLQDLRHDIKSDLAEVRSDMATMRNGFERMRAERASKFEKMHAETAGEFERMRADMATGLEKMRSEMASEFGRMRADMADQIGKVRIETANEFGKVRTEIGAVRTEMASGFGLVAGEFGKMREGAQAIKADPMRWVLLTLVSSAAMAAVVNPLLKEFIN